MLLHERLKHGIRSLHVIKLRCQVRHNVNWSLILQLLRIAIGKQIQHWVLPDHIIYQLLQVWNIHELVNQCSQPVNCFFFELLGNTPRELKSEWVLSTVILTTVKLLFLDLVEHALILLLEVLTLQIGRPPLDEEFLNNGQKYWILIQIGGWESKNQIKLLAHQGTDCCTCELHQSAECLHPFQLYLRFNWTVVRRHVVNSFLVLLKLQSRMWVRIHNCAKLTALTTDCLLRRTILLFLLLHFVACLVVHVVELNFPLFQTIKWRL